MLSSPVLKSPSAPADAQKGRSVTIDASPALRWPELVMTTVEPVMVTPSSPPDGTKMIGLRQPSSRTGLDGRPALSVGDSTTSTLLGIVLVRYGALPSSRFPGIWASEVLFLGTRLNRLMTSCVLRTASP